MWNEINFSMVDSFRWAQNCTFGRVASTLYRPHLQSFAIKSMHSFFYNMYSVPHAVFSFFSFFFFFSSAHAIILWLPCKPWFLSPLFHLVLQLTRHTAFEATCCALQGNSLFSRRIFIGHCRCHCGASIAIRFFLILILLAFDFNFELIRCNATGAPLWTQEDGRLERPMFAQ